MRKAFLFLLILCIGCRKDPEPLPAKAILLLPKNNEICADGVIISASRTKILFKWEASKNSDSYVLSIKNLDNGQISTHSTDKTQLELELDRNLAYSWFISSKNSQINKEISSDLWKFYNPAPAQTSFSPFPAELTAPRYGEVIPLSTATVTLRWSATDPDGDIDSYDVYLGNTNVPVLYRSGLKTAVLADLVLDRNKTYYWKIITRDTKGNRSNSDVYQFKLD
ncbi:hypothetical protein [Daejeonella sp.]|uniref:hypothetical protein n=1 Tax=Daejeonella sp. TaxID=2805397 RepID=UPI002731D7D5|nr:hypothetical protein [Daejeonella sp.]MDP2413456.1 hypothetical protein [Daejeonella sp.]